MKKTPFKTVPSRPLRARGSGLIEVLVAILVLSVGMLSMAKLHSTLIKEGSTANNRAVATKLAQSRLDQLRQFKYISEDTTRPDAERCAQATIACYDEIQAEAVASNVPNFAGFTWQVNNVVTNGTSKNVQVTVSWADANGNGSVALNTTIYAINYNAQAIGDGSGIGDMSDGPSVFHNPGATPDVVPIFVTGDKKREADKPQPDVNQSGVNTVTKFSVATYDATTSRWLKNEEYQTVNCTCTQAGNVDGQLGREPSFDAANIGNMVQKRTATAKSGGQYNQQPAICTTCCRDHHDSSASARKYDPFRPSADFSVTGGDHTHFLNLVSADNTNADYDEACRIVRINGLWYVTADWHLAALVVAPKAYFSTNLSSYQQVVADFIKAYISAIGDSYPQTLPATTLTLSPALAQPYDVNSTTVNAPFELMARGIYIDHMTAGQISTLKAEINSPTVLDKVPFQEVNLTRLVTWSSADPAIATVTNDALTDQSEATYTRGRVVKGTEGGQTTISATIKRSNSGLSVSRPVDAHDEAALTAGLTVSTTGGTATVNKYLWGRFTFGSGTGVSASTISTPTATNSMSCTMLSKNQTVPATNATCGNNDGCYSCVTDNANWSGTLNLEVVTINSNYGVGYCVQPTPNSVVAGTTSTLPGNKTQYKNTLQYNESLADPTTVIRKDIAFTTCP